MKQFEEAKLINLKITTSDHSPILLEPFTCHTEVRVKRIRFENAWLRDPMCGKIVEETWQLNQGKPFTEKISITLEILAKWGKEVTGCFRNRIQQLKRVMHCTKGRKDEYSVKMYQDSSKKLMELGHTWGSSSCLEDWIGEILQHSSRNDMNKVFMVAWAIWKNRNAIVWSQKSQEYDDIVTSALRVLSN
ncbi:hypothetical protein POM88_009133 [Heracleum sosnowskyi]|uniref:Reverse transcriptase n=1 Tax=Heracleum sosnowskyi TaxID=360622 RepID=A0AAD8N2E0_9APIA|nr:hypothetical protein POM88_009133 [Heracleum sosnowskyi]